MSTPKTNPPTYVHLYEGLAHEVYECVVRDHSTLEEAIRVAIPRYRNPIVFVMSRHPVGIYPTAWIIRERSRHELPKRVIQKSHLSHKS